MTPISTDTAGTVQITGTRNNPPALVVLDHDEQLELLEALARIHGFSLVDQEERRELLALCEEVDEDDNDYATGSAAWAAWQDRCEALASAVGQAVGSED